MSLVKSQNFLPHQGINKINLLAVIFLILVSINSEPLAFKRLVEVLQEANKSPFVSMLFVYDSAT